MNDVHLYHKKGSLQSFSDAKSAEEMVEASFLRYYNKIPKGDRASFLLVLRIVLGGSETRWVKRFAAWKRAMSQSSSQPASIRKLHSYEVNKLKRLTDNEKWRDVYKKIMSIPW